MDDFASGYVLGADSGNSNNGGGSFFNSDAIWAIIILAMFGFGNGGWGGLGGGANGAGLQGIATRADINEGFALQNITGGIQGIQQGIADSTYALNNAITNGFHGVDSALCSGFNGVQAGFNSLSHQLSDCCCQNARAIDGVRYDMATQACDTRNLIQTTTRDIVDNQNAGVRQILDFLTQDKIATLTAENQSLKFAASQANQNAFITANQEAQTAELIRRLGRDCPIPAYWVAPPTPVPIPNGCGCGC